ncbi:hypothetical protein SUNI508_11048 [Seiridium unicorne]|uniref:Uncharacterized protein n=1 Tax=Seiridium unicorne TaxID=138068 RepID=A0ABR2UJ05_9PEZI
MAPNQKEKSLDEASPFFHHDFIFEDTGIQRRKVYGKLLVLALRPQSFYVTPGVSDQQVVQRLMSVLFSLLIQYHHWKHVSLFWKVIARQWLQIPSVSRDDINSIKTLVRIYHQARKRKCDIDFTIHDSKKPARTQLAAEIDHWIYIMDSSGTTYDNIARKTAAKREEVRALDERKERVKEMIMEGPLKVFYRPTGRPILTVCHGDESIPMSKPPRIPILDFSDCDMKTKDKMRYLEFKKCKELAAQKLRSATTTTRTPEAFGTPSRIIHNNDFTWEYVDHVFSLSCEDFPRVKPECYDTAVYNHLNEYQLLEGDWARLDQQERIKVLPKCTPNGPTSTTARWYDEPAPRHTRKRKRDETNQYPTAKSVQDKLAQLDEEMRELTAKGDLRELKTVKDEMQILKHLEHCLKRRE